MRRCGLVLLLTALATVSASAQFTPCELYTHLRGWDDTVDTALFGAGSNGPEDVAWNPTSGTLFVAHDVPNAVPDILLEYDLQGNLVQAHANLPGVGGLCAVQGSPNLLTTSANSIIEVDPTGTPVPGGINISVAGYGNIDDLQFDPSGTLWIHDGTSGDFSTVDVSTGARTPRFVLPFGSQGFTFDATGVHMLVAAAHFNPGTFPVGALVKIDILGAAFCISATQTSSQLIKNDDPCVTQPPSFSRVTGMTRIGHLRELVICSELPVGGVNVARFGSHLDAWLARVGEPAVRSDALPFELTWDGDAVMFTTGFSLTVQNTHPGDVLVWAISGARHCANTPFGTNGSALYIDIGPPNILLTTFIPVSTTSVTIPVNLSIISFLALGAELYTQFGGTDLTAPGTPLLLTNAVRVRFLLQ